MTSGMETEWPYSQRKRQKTVNKKGKYNKEKKEASYNKQKEASNKVNKHTNNLYSAKTYDVSRVN